MQATLIAIKEIVLSTVVILSLSIPLCAHALAQDKPDSLEFHMRFEKDTFLVSEPIWLDLYLTNIGYDTIGVKPLSLAGGWLKITLINSRGDTLVPYASEVINFEKGGPTYIIAPNETLYICRNLLDATGLGEKETLVMFWRSHLQSDNYRIRATYREHLESNELSFLVVNPTGPEREARRLWIEGCQNYRKPKWDLSLTAWKNLLHKYPTSVYAPGVCLELSNIYQVVKGDLETCESYQKKLLSGYPNSGCCQYAFAPFLRGKTQEEREQVLKELEKMYAGTRVAKFAINIRKNILAY